jgi:hypothetical protein
MNPKSFVHFYLQHREQMRHVKVNFPIFWLDVLAGRCGTSGQSGDGLSATNWGLAPESVWFSCAG